MTPAHPAASAAALSGHERSEPSRGWSPRPVRIARASEDLADRLVLGPSADALRGDHLWHGRVAADVPVSAADRARSAVRGCGLPGLVDEHLRPEPAEGVAEGRSLVTTTARGGVLVLLAAAWVHTGGPPPAVLDVCLPRPVRARFGPVRFRAARLASRDVVLVGGVRVTSPLSTACDLARAAGAPGSSDAGAGAGTAAWADDAPLLTDDPAVEALRALLRHGVSAESVQARLLTDRRARARRARLLVASL